MMSVSSELLNKTKDGNVKGERVKRVVFLLCWVKRSSQRPKIFLKCRLLSCMTVSPGSVLQRHSLSISGLQTRLKKENNKNSGCLKSGLECLSLLIASHIYAQ